MNMMTKPVAVMIVLVDCLTMTHASRVDLLQKENALLRVENVAQKTEIARLTAENAHLRAQVSAASSVDDMLVDAARLAPDSTLSTELDTDGLNEVSPSVKLLIDDSESGTEDAVQLLARKSKRRPQRREETAEESAARTRKILAARARHKIKTKNLLRQAAQATKPNGWPHRGRRTFCRKWRSSKTACEKAGCTFNGWLQCGPPKTSSDKCFWARFGRKRFGGGVAGDRCKWRCDLLPTVINKDCTVPETQLMTIRKCVVRDVAAPAGTMRWKIYRHSSWQEMNDVWPGRVGFDEISCPCNNRQGKPLSETEALRRILGQSSSMRPSLALVNARRAKELGRRNTAALLEPVYMLKAGIAAFLMHKCWKAKCSVGSAAEQVNLQLGTGYGGGTEC